MSFWPTTSHRDVPFPITPPELDDDSSKVSQNLVMVLHLASQCCPSQDPGRIKSPLLSPSVIPNPRRFGRALVCRFRGRTVATYYRKSGLAQSLPCSLVSAPAWRLRGVSRTVCQRFRAEHRWTLTKIVLTEALKALCVKRFSRQLLALCLKGLGVLSCPVNVLLISAARDCYNGLLKLPLSGFSGLHLYLWELFRVSVIMLMLRVCLILSDHHVLL